MSIEFFVLVLFEPLKSAEPPISSGKFACRNSSTICELFLVARESELDDKPSINLSKSESKLSGISPLISLCIKSNLSGSDSANSLHKLSHSFSRAIPFSTALHESYICLSSSNGS